MKLPAILIQMSSRGRISFYLVLSRGPMFPYHQQTRLSLQTVSQEKIAIVSQQYIVRYGKSISVNIIKVLLRMRYKCKTI